MMYEKNNTKISGSKKGELSQLCWQEVKHFVLPKTLKKQNVAQRKQQCFAQIKKNS